MLNRLFISKGLFENTLIRPGLLGFIRERGFRGISGTDYNPKMPLRHETPALPRA